MPVFIPAAASLVAGGVQALIGGINARKARQSLENLKTPTYTPSKAINDYYNLALNRYYTNPFQSMQYQAAKQAAGQGLATGLNALTNRRAAVGNTGALVQGYNNNLLRAGAQAEGQQQQNFNTLGRATQMQSGENKYAFGINQMLPYQKNFQLDISRLQGSNQVLNAGLSNIFGGIQNAGAIAMGNQTQFGNIWGRRNSGMPGSQGYTPPSNVGQYL